ncbi:MAG TPA: c-type cytochrome domain-containing protein, partial [Chitinophagaceae bacterium]|nr:c-type cytochrome domain-containing protein [Chitinophagaceae bacterium]
MLLSFTEFIGRLHPLFVHLPIGILLMALLFSLLARKEQYTLSHSIMKLVWSIGSFFSLLSCITGYLLSFSGEYEEGSVNLHMWLGISVALVSVFITFKVYQRRFDILYTILCVGLLLLIAGTGHYGGSLTHGEEYLTAALYSDEDEPAASMIKPLANVQEATVYKDVVVPILQSRCYSCHGPKKQKGKLRMDTPEHLLKGGKNGEILIPGNSTESELMKRVLLPLEDDDHMAPKGKLQLTKNQVVLLKWWIEGGASFEKKVKDLAQNDKLKPILAALEGAEEKEKAPDTIWPTEPIQAADQTAVDS